MKKSFLILGVLASIVAVDTHAKTNNDNNNTNRYKSTTTIDCPEGCHDEKTMKEIKLNGAEIRAVIDICIKDGGTVENPEDFCDIQQGMGSVPHKVKNVENISEGASSNKLMQGIKVKKDRSAKIMVPQKIVYKEIYFDDSVDEIEE